MGAKYVKGTGLWSSNVGLKDEIANELKSIEIIESKRLKRTNKLKTAFKLMNYINSTVLQMNHTKQFKTCGNDKLTD